MNENRKYKSEIENLNSTIQTIQAELQETENKLGSVANIVGN